MNPAGAIGTLVVGYGYWGPNIVRNVVESPEFRLMGLCELDEGRAEDFRRRHPGIWIEPDLDAALADPRIEAVAIATPPHTHYNLVRRALEAGKHVLVEKPLARTATEAAALTALADELGLVMMPGHTFVYSPSVNAVRDLIQTDELGEIYFITSSRMNLGLYQQDGVVLDLAPHDISILLHWLDKPLLEVSATGRSVFQEGVHETAFLTLRFEGGTQANVQLSWLAPRKMRQMVVVGSRRMVQYEDTAADDSVRIYDRGLDFAEPPANFGEYRLTYRTGDMVAPRVPALEPLGQELKDWASAIRQGTTPVSNAHLGLEIVLCLEALEESLQNRGKPVAVRSVAEAMSAARTEMAAPVRNQE
ncbi:MAG TPA: Gfo/Idh/MocA family oxidoreductase [Solirubrobacterales bacterium]|nr:Gfo/Idh/MocA family oxidoreductase [Solirubrobacterales bacterium]